MLVKVPEDAWVITQKALDGHTYTVAAGRIFSHRSEAERAFTSLVTSFDSQVACGKGGAWRPELRAIKWA